MTTAIILARGGSKGIPRKNLQRVGGTTLVARAIETALAATDRVVVSTDDAEIASEAESYGAVIHHRSAELATDTAEAWPAIQDAASTFPDD